MKKILLLILILILSTTMGACTKGESAEEATSNALKAIKHMDEVTLSKYLDVDKLVEQNIDSSDSDGFGEEEMLVIFENIEYKINSSKEDGDSAIVNADITNIDMEIVFGKWFQESIEFAFSNAFSPTTLTDEEMEAKMSEMLFSIIDQNKENVITSNVDIQLHKVDNGWKIDLDDDLQNALMGNLLDVLSSLDDSF